MVVPCDFCVILKQITQRCVQIGTPATEGFLGDAGRYHADGAKVELYQIRYYLALCDTLNFARAAERCNVSQPSLSRAVKALEHELGGLLIRREHRRTHLTELGRTLRPMLQ